MTEMERDNTTIVRLSIIGNECVHCGTIITKNIQCQGCGWIDPASIKPK